MALAINNTPSNTVSVNDEMIFTVYESTKVNDEVTYPDYQYVCDVYIDGDLVARMKSRPDPSNKRGVFDVSKVLQNYVSYGLKANYANTTESYDAKTDYTLHFGEEYDFVLYPDVLVDDERSAFKSYEVRPFDDSTVVPATKGLCTSRPSPGNSYKDIKWDLISYMSNVSGISDFTANFVDKDGVQVGATVTISTAGYVANTFLQVNFSFLKLSTLLTEEEKERVCKLNIYGVGEESSIVPDFVINYQCTKHTPYVIAWLNKFGVYESQAFGLVSKESSEVTRKGFQQLNYRMNDEGAISYSENGVYYGGKRTFATNTQVNLRMTSHLLSADEYEWLQEMFSSPDVYLFSPTLDKFLPVQIQETQYEKRNYSNSRLTPLQFSVLFSDNYNAQFL